MIPMALLEESILTSITDVLLGLLLLAALEQVVGGLHLEYRTRLAEAVGAEGIHGALQGIALPAKEVVTMGTITGPGCGVFS